MQADSYPVIVVPKDAPRRDEHMGSKGKFWYKDDDFGWCLFKQGRSGTAEDFAEKAAAELAAMLGLPHARVEFAQSGDGCLPDQSNNGQAAIQTATRFAEGYFQRQTIYL